MKLNEFDNLRYEEAKRRPLHDIMDGYNKRNPMKQEKPSDSVEALRERYLKDRNSLSSIELLTLGMSELQSKRDAVLEERQKAIDDYMQPYHENKDKQEEYISTNSEEFQQLAKQMAELQAEFND
ncbi:hypothetical protein COJ96_09110 [Bacillus sp. AFS073361]|uniref:hypothetical protein n=1 Tax=Bacillus sp. AFS073361 TaxID=2033511 RepID=UPI000BF9BECD|nr:hypothetical protein [Bacillus sp. AFS073361]PFP29832.1 hypothetical protein COJ96_09110 [Bacillus sp. AFS073361]